MSSMVIRKTLHEAEFSYFSKIRNEKASEEIPARLEFCRACLSSSSFATLFSINDSDDHTRKMFSEISKIDVGGILTQTLIDF